LPIFIDQVVKTTALVPVWHVPQLKVVGLIAGETACMIQILLTHETSVHKGCFERKLYYYSWLRFLWSLLTTQLGTLYVKSFLMGWNPPHHREMWRSSSPACNVPSVFTGCVQAATSTVHTVIAELSMVLKLWRTFTRNGLWWPWFYCQHVLQKSLLFITCLRLLDYWLPW